MSPLVRASLLAAALLAVFLAAFLALQGWLGRKGTEARELAVGESRRALAAALDLAPRAPEAWDEAHRRTLGAVAGADVRLRRGDPAGPKADYSLALPGHPGWSVDAAVAPRAAELQQRRVHSVLATTLMLALVLGSLPLVLAGLRPRPGGDRETRAPWRAARAEAAGLERFARLTVERGAELEREHGARRRAEEDLEVSRSLLERSLAERVRLGRELHDNVSQTLYAVTLTLESVRKHLDEPPAAVERLDGSMAELRRLNREVRAFLRELDPGAVQGAALGPTLEETLAAMAGAGGVEIERRLDDAALARLPSAHAADVVNIVREAVSNAVRHGRARRIAVRAARAEDRLALSVADDGAGFAPAGAAGDGRGLGNMRARAAALGGELQVESAPGRGTRIVLVLPLARSPA
jgi:signal transduction histidine kinase